MSAPSADTADRLRRALGAVADGVQPRPDAYQRALAEWRRRELRRRAVGLVLACLAFVAADSVGVWVLNQRPSAGSVVFGAPPPALLPALPPALPPAPPPAPTGGAR